MRGSVTISSCVSSSARCLLPAVPARIRSTRWAASPESGGTPRCQAAPAFSCAEPMSAAHDRPGPGCRSRYLPDALPEVRVASQLGELHPGIDLLRGRVVKQVRGGAPARRSSRAGLQALEHLGGEVVDDLPALGCRQPGQFVHHGHLHRASRSINSASRGSARNLAIARAIVLLTVPIAQSSTCAACASDRSSKTRSTSTVRWRAANDPSGGPVAVAKACRLLHAIFTPATDDRLVRRNACHIENAGKEDSRAGRRFVAFPADLVPELRWHTGGTLAAATGATLKELMARLGHSSTAPSTMS